MYGTIEQADSCIAARYSSDSEERVRWEALSKEDKAVYLGSAFDAIEALPFRGRKASSSQETAFPRLPYQYGHTDEGAPARVIAAQAELGLYLSDTKSRKSSSKRRKLRQDGVKSYSIGDLSESFGDTPVTASGCSAEKCEKAMELLAPYLSGGYDIC